MANMSFRDALNAALQHEMSSDESVFLFGLDVDDHKSIFGSTKELKNKFGSGRVFGTPLSEDAMTGFAIGSALNGKKAIHVHIRADFSLLAVNQIINMASNLRYMSAGQLKAPITIRMVVGRGWGQGFQHSKSLHSLFAHFPGLKIFIPTGPQEAYSLMRQAVQEEDPVLFMEHRWLYDIEGDVDFAKTVKPGTAQLSKGDHLTIVASSWMNIEALKAQEVLKTINISSDIFNINSLAPLQLQDVVRSVKRTGHCIVVDHDWREFGLASELAAQIYEGAFAELKKPIVRLGNEFIPCPTSRSLENEFYAKAQDIISSACEMLNLPYPDLRLHEFYSYEKKFKGPF
ncbi:MAG: alpha-ketoacid dehydrogenase subunit beta [Pseudobdellovibrio sp.]